VQITKSDNCDDDSGEDGYDINIIFDKNKCIGYVEYYIEELEDKPMGIYEYVDGKYIQIENWEE
jgi:hypothetical protein